MKNFKYLRRIRKIKKFGRKLALAFIFLAVSYLISLISFYLYIHLSQILMPEEKGFTGFAIIGLIAGFEAILISLVNKRFVLTVAISFLIDCIVDSICLFSALGIEVIQFFPGLLVSMSALIVGWSFLQRKYGLSIKKFQVQSGPKKQVYNEYALAHELIKNPNKLTLDTFKEACGLLEGIDPKIDAILKKADYVSRTLKFLRGDEIIGFVVSNIKVKTKEDEERKEKLLFFIDLVNDIREEVNLALVRVKAVRVENIRYQNTPANIASAAIGPTSLATVSMTIIAASTIGIANAAGVIPNTPFLLKSEQTISETQNSSKDLITPDATSNVELSVTPSLATSSTPTPRPVLTFSTIETTIFVSAVEEGTTYNAPSTGTYRFTITGGAYLADPAKGWEAKVMLYKNRSIDWSGPNNTHTNWDYLVGYPGDRYPDFKPTREEAEQLGKGQSIDIFLNKDEYLIFMVFDSKGDFVDNLGGMYVQVQKGTLITPTTHAVVEGTEFIPFAECSQTPTNINTLNVFFGKSQKDSTVEVEAGKSFWIGMSDGLNDGQFKDGSDKGKADANAFVNEEIITFSVFLNSSVLKLNDDTKLEYTYAGHWELYGYYCSGALATGSHKIIGTTYHKGNYVDSASFTLTAK